MKIGIDAQTTLGQKTGFGFYVKNLAENLQKIDQENQYFLLKPNSEKDLRTMQRFYWDQWKLPCLAKKLHLDILHQPCFSVPIRHGRMKVVVTIHDSIAIRFGKDIPFFSRLYFAKWMPFSYHWADKIIAISQHTKQDIIKFLGIAGKKIKVIYSAAGKEFTQQIKQQEIARIRKKYQIQGKYFLHTGTLNPRKNLEFLIKVFAKVLPSQPDSSLVIVGKKGWYFEGLFTLVRTLNLKKKVIFIGYVPDQDLPALYNGASIFLFPSLYEGFGLPPLEAMACGTPVISSNTSSLPEVVGQGGILISPKDELRWVRSIIELISQQKLKKRLIALGLQQARKFSWEKCAQETLSVYQEVSHQ